MNVFAEPKLLQVKYRPLVLPAIYFVSLVLLVFIAVAFFIAIRQPYDGLYWEKPSGKVVQVDANAPATVAGLQPDDILLAVAGRPIDEFEDGEPLIAAGDTAQIMILRGGETLFVEMSAESPPTAELLKRTIPLFVAICFALFSFGIWAYRPHDWRVILFWAFNQLGAAGLAFGTVSNLGYLWATRWFGVTLCLFSPVLIHFHSQVVETGLKPLPRRLLQGLYGLSSILAMVWFFNSQGNDNRAYTFLTLVIQLYFIIAIIFTVLLLTRAYFLASLPSWKRRVRLVVLGALLAFTPLVGLALLPHLLFGRALIAYELTFPFLLILPLSHLVAIYHSTLLQIERLINRRIVHLALMVILSVIYLVGFITISSLWSVSNDWEPLLWGGITLFGGILFIFLRDRLQNTIDHLVYGGWYNYRSVVAEMGRGLDRVIDSEELADLLVNRLIDILHLECAAFLLCSDQMQLTLIRAVGYNSLPPDLDANTTLVSILLHTEHVVSTKELHAQLTKTTLTPLENLWLEHPQIKIWVPIKRNKQVQALLLLGKRLDGELFDEEDRHMLNTLTWGAATAIENVKLVRVLQQRTREVNLLYSQLLQSREEERKRLARELHDGVIQNLINLHYYLDPASRRLSPTTEKNGLRSRLQQVIDELRDVCTQLRPAALDDLSLALAIQGYVEDVREQYGLPVELKVSGGEFPKTQRLPEVIEVCLFRVLQEAVTNVYRHAEATQIWIDLQLKPGFALLEVRDDGKGFLCPANLGSFTREHHFGLAGVQERLHLIGGTLTIDSMPGKGSTLRAEVSYTLPLAAPATGIMATGTS